MSSEGHGGPPHISESAWRSTTSIINRLSSKSHRQQRLVLALAALGVVYGDIGTSPLYALRQCFHSRCHLPVTPEGVLGIISLIFWSLALVISIKYLLFLSRNALGAAAFFNIPSEEVVELGQQIEL